MFIRKEIAASVSGGETSSVELVVDTSDGTSEIEIRKTIIECYPVTELEKVLDLHERLNRGGGRRVWKLEDLTK